MNILIISPVFPPEPVTSALLNYDLALALSKEHNVTVIRQRPSRPMGSNYKIIRQEFPFTCVTLNSYVYPESKLWGRLRESYSFGKRSAEYIRRHKDEIDIIYNDSWALFGYFLSAKACVQYNIQYMTPIQDIYPEGLFTKRNYPAIVKKLASYLMLPLDKYNQRHACKVRTISKEMADYLSKTRGVPRNNYLVVDNWQNDEDFVYTPVTNNKIVFGYVGSINSHSNTELIIKAFMQANIQNAELRIFGGGSHKEQCMQLVKEFNIDNVSFSIIERNKVPKAQSDMSVLVLALPKGNGALCLPSKMTSYMLSGRPILASVETSATTRYIAEANCGLYVEPDNIEALANGFRAYSNKKLEELNILGWNGRIFAEKHLSRSANLPKVVEALINCKQHG